MVHSASVQDRDGAVALISRLSHKFLLLKHIWADGGYAGELVHILVFGVYNFLGWTVVIVKRSDTLKKFVLLPRRWVVERTFAKNLEMGSQTSVSTPRIITTIQNTPKQPFTPPALL